MAQKRQRWWRGRRRAAGIVLAAMTAAGTAARAQTPGPSPTPTATIRWIGPGSGAWETAAHWDAGRTPGAADHVANTTGRDVALTAGSFSISSLVTTGILTIGSIGSLANDATLDIAGDLYAGSPYGLVRVLGGTLRVGGHIDPVSNPAIYLENGRLVGATLYNFRLPSFSSHTGNVLSGVTLKPYFNSNRFLVVSQNGYLRIADAFAYEAGAIFDLATHDLSNLRYTTTLAFDGDRTLDNATFNLGRQSFNNGNGTGYLQSGNGGGLAQTLTLGPNTLVQGGSGVIGGSVFAGSVASVVNRGTISAREGGVLTGVTVFGVPNPSGLLVQAGPGGGDIVNHGTMKVGGDYTGLYLTLNGPGTLLNASGGLLDFGDGYARTGAIDTRAGVFDNRGTIRMVATNGDLLITGGEVANFGKITAAASAPGYSALLRLNGLRVTTAQFIGDQINTGLLLGGGATVRFGGVLDNTGTGFDVRTLTGANGAKGSFTLDGGTVRGGTVAGLDLLLVSNSTANRFDGVTLGAGETLTVSRFGGPAFVGIENGLAFGAGATVRLGVGEGTGTLRLVGSQTLSAGQTYLLGIAASGFSGGGTLDSDAALTLAGGALVQGRGSVIVRSGGLTNRGTLRASGTGSGSFTISSREGGAVVNEGLIEAAGGSVGASGSVSTSRNSAAAPGAITNSGTLRANGANASLSLTAGTAALGSSVTNTGAAEAVGGGTLRFNLFTAGTAFTNETGGAIIADGAGSTVSVTSGWTPDFDFINRGTITARNGGRVFLTGRVPAAGDIGSVWATGAGSSVVLGGSYTGAQIAPLMLSDGGRGEIAGTLDMGGATLDPDAYVASGSTGTFALVGTATLRNAALTETDRVRITGAVPDGSWTPGVTLTNVSLLGTNGLTVTSGYLTYGGGTTHQTGQTFNVGTVGTAAGGGDATLFYEAGLTFDKATVNLGAADGSTLGTLSVRRLGADALVRGAGAVQNPAGYSYLDSYGTLNGTVTGKTLQLTMPRAGAQSGGDLINYGTVAATVAGANVGVSNLTFTSLRNQGYIGAQAADGSATVSGKIINTGTFAADAAGSTLLLDLSVADHNGTLGSLENTGLIRVVDGATFTIKGGANRINRLGGVSASGADALIRLDTTLSTAVLTGGNAAVSLSGGARIDLIGQLNNAGAILDLNAAFGGALANGDGVFRLAGGASTALLSGGTLAGGRLMRFSEGRFNRLIGVTFAGPGAGLDINAGGYVRLANGTSTTVSIPTGSVFNIGNGATLALDETTVRTGGATGPLLDNAAVTLGAGGGAGTLASGLPVWTGDQTPTGNTGNRIATLRLGAGLFVTGNGTVGGSTYYTDGTVVDASVQSAAAITADGAGEAIRVTTAGIGTLTNSGTMTATNGGAVTVAPGGVGAVTNSGALRALGAGSALTITGGGGALTSTGTLEAGAGARLNIEQGASAFTNGAGGVLLARGGATVTFSSASGASGASGTAATTNAGAVETEQEGRIDAVGLSGAFATTGTVTLGAGTVADFGAAGVTQSTAASVTTVDGTLNLQSGGVYRLQGGLLKGSGAINGDVVNTGGTFSPGNPPGFFNIVGDYTQSGTGALLIEVTGSDWGQYDFLNVSGDIRLGGEVILDLAGYAPPTGGGNVFFTFFQAQGGTITGGFSKLTVKNAASPTSAQFFPFNGSNGGTPTGYGGFSLSSAAETVPEPGTLPLLGGGFLAAAGARRRRRRRSGANKAAAGVSGFAPTGVQPG